MLKIIMENCGFVVIKDDGTLISGDMMVEYSSLISLSKEDFKEILIYKDVSPRHLKILLEDKIKMIKEKSL